MTYGELCRRVREQIGQEHRYAHSVRVARMAERLARIHGADPSKGRLAGILHDLARLYSNSRLVEECDRHGMVLTDFERANPIVLHAPLSAELARERFGVNDAGVLCAIAKHTLAAGEMSTLDCVLYLADGLEPGRNFAERAQLAALADRDLGEAMRATLAASLRYLRERGLRPAPQTLAAMKTFGLTEELTEAHAGGRP